MARPLRLELTGGWYHVMARGNERRAIVRDDKDRGHFVELLAQVPERFGIRLHAYALLDNHYHLLLETPLANLSAAMQWLQVSHAMWFNRRHRRSGHLFQGRFHAIVLEAESAAVELSRYIHLNPVRVQWLGLDKLGQARARAGVGDRPDPQQLRQRLERLRTYGWSSYPAYAGRKTTPPWLTTEAVLTLGGGRTQAAQQTAYRRYVEAAVREGLAESPWERVQAGVVLGSKEFVERIRQQLSHADAREQPAVRRLQARPDWIAVVAAVERVKGERWVEFRDRYGDWGRDVALYVARRHGLRLRELAGKVGGIDYGSVASAVARVQQRRVSDRQLAALIKRVELEMQNN